jgi:anti-sigma-K factor RskA
VSCQELTDHYELYVLGLADEPEQAEIQAHLARGCDVCGPAVRRARECVAVLGATAPFIEPSPKFRRRLLASAGFEQRRFGWTPIWAAATALALVAAVYFSGRERQFASELGRVRGQMRQQTIELTRLNDALSILNAPDTTETIFGQGQSAPPKGKVFVNPAAGVLLLASNLPPAPAGKIYEMWVIPKTGTPRPAGLFQSETSGTAMHLQQGPVDVGSTAAVAVTLENEGGAQQPTSQPLIVAPIPQRPG